MAEAAPEGAAVLVQDYHLALLGPALAEQRPDVTAVHFSHTPFATPTWLRTLPDQVVGDLLAGLAAHRACGFTPAAGPPTSRLLRAARPRAPHVRVAAAR